MREPTIMSQLPPHPNLLLVLETILTPGHFYLVESYLSSYITLESLLLSTPAPHVLPPATAHRILSQLVSVVRGALQGPIQVVHRDIKPENVLIHPETLHLVLIDFGLATHYSGSEAN